MLIITADNKYDAKSADTILFDSHGADIYTVYSMTMRAV